MNMQETIDLLTKIKATYPYFNLQDAQGNLDNNVIDMWGMILKDADYERTIQRFVTYAGENEFPPKPADVKATAPKPNETLALRDKWRKEAAEVPQETKDEFARRLEELSRKLGSK